MKTPAAENSELLTPSSMGQLSWKKRSKGKTKKQISEHMRALAMKRHAKVDKTA
jgi:hypothetical protein